MDLINSFLKRQLNHRLITAILVALIVNAIFGFINMVLNYSIVQANADNLNVPVIVMYIFAPVVSFISLGANVFSMSLITYFVAAFLGFGFNYQQFVKLSARCCVWIPVMTLIDTLQFMIVGKRLISYSIFGLVCYIPFYFLIYHSIPVYSPKYIPIDEKKMRLFSIAVTFLMVAATYPSNAY